MKASLLTIICLTAVPAATALGQFSSYTSPYTSAVQDAMYDFDLYVADPGSATGWYILWTWEDGSTMVSHAFTSESLAKSHHDRLMWHGVDPRGGWYDSDNGFSAEYFSAPREPDWEFFARYGTRAAAAEQAEWFQNFGLLTQVRKVSVIQRRVTRTAVTRRR